MATYDIDKITLPNGDICNLVTKSDDIYRNRIINSKPDKHPNGAANFFSPTHWGVAVAGSGLATTQPGSYNQLTIQINRAPTSSSEYVQIQKYIFYDRTSGQGGLFGGIDLTDLEEGDWITLSFDIKCAMSVSILGALRGQETTSSPVLYAINSTISNPASSDWTRVSFTGAIPVGWKDIMTAPFEGGGYFCLFSLNITPSGPGELALRNFKLNKGNVATEYTENPLDQIFRFGAGSTYLRAREAALFQNRGNVYGNTGQLYPVTGVKSQTGFWSSGTVGDTYLFAYTSDTNYEASQNYAETYSLPIPNSTLSGITQYNIWTTKQIPAPPTSNGTYTLKATVSNGNVTYSWS